MKKILFLLVILLPCLTVANDFNSFESYDNSKKYARGSYVKYSNNLWVARHKAIGTQPEEVDHYPSKTQLKTKRKNDITN